MLRTLMQGNNEILLYSSWLDAVTWQNLVVSLLAIKWSPSFFNQGIWIFCLSLDSQFCLLLLCIGSDWSNVSFIYILKVLWIRDIQKVVKSFSFSRGFKHFHLPHVSFIYWKFSRFSNDFINYMTCLFNYRQISEFVR